MRFVLATVFVLCSLEARAAEPPLPESAVARLGTTKFRTSGTDIVLAPDGTRAAVRVTDGVDVLDLDTGEVVARLRDEKKLAKPKEPLNARHITFAFAGGKELVTANAEPEVWVWDVRTGRSLRSIAAPKREDNKPGAVYGVFNCQLADFLIAETSVWPCWQKLDPKTGKWADAHGGQIISDVSPDGRWISDYCDLALDEDYVGVADTANNKRAFNGKSASSYPHRQSPSPDGAFVACVTDNEGIEAWNTATKKALELKGQKRKDNYWIPRFSPDSKVLIVEAWIGAHGDEPHFARWNVATGERLTDWKLPVRITSWVVDHKNNRLVVIAGEVVFRIDLATGKITPPPEGFIGAVRPALSADGKRAAVGDGAGVLRVWDAPFTGEPRTLRALGSEICDLQFSKDGKTLFAGYRDRTVGVWNVATGKEQAVLKPPAGDLSGRFFQRAFRIAVSPDGKVLVGGAPWARLWGWDVVGGKVLWELAPDKDGRGITKCRPAFTPDGSAFYYGRERGEVSKLDLLTGKELERFEAPVFLHRDVALALAPDGKKLAVHTADSREGFLVVCKPGSSLPLWREKFGSADALDALAFSADGLTLLTTHADGMIRGWKVADGARAFALRGPVGRIQHLQLGADGALAITDAPGATALVWKLPK
jgi:WD40 repeat protein